MSFREFQAGFVAPFQTEFLGEEVTRLIGGDAAATDPQRAVVERVDVRLATGRGRAFQYDYVMRLDPELSVTLDDMYVIGGETCRVSRIGDIEDGLRPVWLQRIDDIRTEATGNFIQ